MSRPTTDRDAHILKRHEEAGLSVAELAALFGLSPTGIRGALKRARGRRKP